MTIAAVGTQEGGAAVDSSATASRAFGSNVAVGNLIVVSVDRFIAAGATDPFVAGDCIQSAGTATLDAITLDVQFTQDAGAAEFIQSAVWSCVVTGAGSCTMQVSGAAGDFWTIASGEYSGSAWDSTRVETTKSAGSATDNATPGSTGSATSAGGALFYGVIALATSGAETITHDGTYALLFEEENGALHEVGSHIRRIVSSGTTIDANWTLSANHRGYAAALAVYKEVAAASVVPVPSMGCCVYVLP